MIHRKASNWVSKAVLSELIACMEEWVRKNVSCKAQLPPASTLDRSAHILFALDWARVGHC